MDKPSFMTYGSLFAGIGGFELGFNRAGFKLAWEVEIDPFCRKVLRKNFRPILMFPDVARCEQLPYCDIICGGFPCQDISKAGKGAGINGSKSSLWFEMLRIIRQVGPKFILVENVASLRKRGLSKVLGGLAESGYDAEWLCLNATQFGAPHQRRRMFILGWNPNKVRCLRYEREEFKIPNKDPYSNRTDWWESEPHVGRMADGFSRGLDVNKRLECLANSVIPQAVEWFGQRIKDSFRDIK